LIVPKLSDLGITKTQSSRWQELAELDAGNFETKVEQASTRAYDGIARRFIKEKKIERAKQRHRDLIADGCRVDDLIALAESGKRFSLIYADPAWPWSTWSDSGKVQTAPDNHYDTSPLDEIARLPVAALADEHCALLLWCTWPHIVIGTHIEIIRAWGFKPSTCGFLWAKQNPSGDGFDLGQGYWTRSNSETCLLATKGSPLRLAADVRQLVIAPVGEHSAKPEEVRRRIERLFTGPYLELYARRRVDGWTQWGNELPALGLAEGCNEH
jgi:N6-adenosine-specific RNA methylase IME4